MSIYDYDIFLRTFYTSRMSICNMLIDKYSKKQWKDFISLAVPWNVISDVWLCDAKKWQGNIFSYQNVWWEEASKCERFENSIVGHSSLSPQGNNQWRHSVELESILYKLEPSKDQNDKISTHLACCMAVTVNKKEEEWSLVFGYFMLSHQARFVIIAGMFVTFLFAQRMSQ